MNTWQLCPKCQGQGQPTGTGFCDLCNGTKVISTFTGRPPATAVQPQSITSTTTEITNIDKDTPFTKVL